PCRVGQPSPIVTHGAPTCRFVTGRSRIPRSAPRRAARGVPWRPVRTRDLTSACGRASEVSRVLFKRQRSEAEALQLCLITGRDGARLPAVEGITVIEFRDLVTVSRRTQFARVEPGEEAISAYREAVERVFACRPVVPAPLGTVFRDRDSLLRWLELHYFTLADAVRYFQGRQAARVRVTPARGGDWDTREYRLRGADLEVTAFDSFRVMRREAVAFVPIR